MMTLLCVDDEPLVLKAIKRELTEIEDLTIVTAGSVKDALRICDEREVHVLLSDLRMPGETGLELCQLLRKTRPDIVRSILTGHADVEVTVAAINEGAVHRFLMKPWKRGELVTAIRACLAESQRLREERAKSGVQEVEKKGDALGVLDRAFPGICQAPRREGPAIVLDETLLGADLDSFLQSFAS